MEGKENFKEDYAAQDVEKVVSPETEEVKLFLKAVIYGSFS